ncbi:hypothetical protein QFC19_008956 [Naganishia cerealis]|uniref:Uncharacterized protein n=1 Tax=Naganishia cerealis TaxID=610337 RepID=A0ACC2UYD2_9TREE|nr:hypothetical protein QFC19_008956 [Naganishia cerealis]
MRSDSSDEEMPDASPDIADIQLQIELDAENLHKRMQQEGSGDLLSSSASADCLHDQEDEEDDNVSELEAIMEGIDFDDHGHTLQSIFTIPGHDAIGPPEWGNDLTARIRQEQHNAKVQATCNTSASVDGSVLNEQPPTGPANHILIPVTQTTFMKIYDGMQNARSTKRSLYPESPFENDVMQFVQNNSCSWLDRNLYKITEIEDITFIRRVTKPAPRGQHFLIGILRPEYQSRWRMLNPISGIASTSDSRTEWVTLDDPTPRRSPPAISDLPFNQQDKELRQPNDMNQLPCQVSMDVDSVLILSDKIPLCQPIEIRAIPAKADTVQYSNKLYMAAGSKKERVLLSKIPNFRLGRAGRVTTNMFFPGLYDPSLKGFGSAYLSQSERKMVWDDLVLPAVNFSFPSGIDNLFLESFDFEMDRHAEQGNRDGQSARAGTLPSDILPKLVQKMRHLVSETTEPALQRLQGFKFLLSFQGFKLFSFTPYDDFTHAEKPWFDGLKLSDSYIRQAMFYKAYLKGLRRVTQGCLNPNWLDFNGLLQDGIRRFERLAAWDESQCSEDDFLDGLPGDQADRRMNPNRKREGPSLRLIPNLTELCDGEGCLSCQVFLDTAAEVGCAGKVTVWDHHRCFQVV